MFMCVVNLKLVNKLDLTWKQSFLIPGCWSQVSQEVSEADLVSALEVLTESGGVPP
jgi:hypothetical protein